MDQSWLTKSAAELGRAIGAGRIDPVDLTQAYLDAIAAHPDGSRIYVRATPGRALAEAKAARARARTNSRLGPLDGVPVSWKDLFDTAGIETSAGSRLLDGRVPDRDARVLETATLGGSVCLGKTHMSELAFSGLGLNPMFETPPCVNDPDAVPGGSSSGAAASVAFGLAPLAIGSDTGGSVRIPSAWNDLVGLKTTTGRLSLTGVVPLAESFDTVGPLCRTVEDAALALALMEGTAPVDLTGVSLKGVRLGLLNTMVFDDIWDAPRAGFNSAVERLQAAGAVTERFDCPELADAFAMVAALVTTEAYGTWKDRIEAAPDKMFPEILERFRIGATHAGADYVAAWRRLRDIRAVWNQVTAGYDAVILPTVANLPLNRQKLAQDHEFYVRENLLALRNTRVGNLMGSCGLTLPTGVPSTGITFLAAPMAERRLLRLGRAAEAALA